jgi:hypothetical protein
MTKARDLLQSVSEGFSIDSIIDEYMPILTTTIRPEVKIANAPRAGWLGQDAWRYGQNPTQGKWWDDNTVISIQKSILGDENTLRRVIAHELCHHDAALSAYVPFLKDIDIQTFQKLMKIRGQHDTEWRKVAAKFNAKYGVGFVTEKSDHSYKTELTGLKDMIVVVMKISGDRYVFAVSSRLSAKQKGLLDRYKSDPDKKITKSNDARFLRGASIGSSWSLPPDPETQNKLAQLFAE